MGSFWYGRAMRGSLLLLLLLAACGGAAPPAPIAATVDDERGDLLARVPAATAYLHAALEPTPAVEARATLGMGRHLTHWLDLLAAIARRAPEELAELDPPLRLMYAVATTFAGRDLDGIVEEVGIDPRGRYVVYGRPAWPTMRAELASGARFREAIGILLDRARIEAAPERIGDAEAWRFPLGERLVLVVAVEPRHVTLALGPPSLAAAEVLAPVEAPIAIGGLVDDARRRLGREPVSVGFVDLRRVGAVVAAIVPAEDRACVGSVLEVLGHAPRATWATGAPAGAVMTSRLDVALSERAVDVLGALAGPIPMWPASRDDRVFLELGIGLDARGAIRHGVGWFEQALAVPACRAMPVPAQELAEARALADGVLATVRGATVALASTGEPGVSLPEALVAVASSDPAALLAAVEQELGEALPATPAAGGPPVSIDAVAPFLAPLRLVRTEHALAASIGATGAAILGDRARAGALRALYAMRVDQAEQQYQDALEDYAELVALDEELAELMPPPDRADFAGLGELTVHAALGARGLEIEVVQRFAR